MVPNSQVKLWDSKYVLLGSAIKPLFAELVTYEDLQRMAVLQSYIQSLHWTNVMHWTGGRDCWTHTFSLLVSVGIDRMGRASLM